MPFAPQLGMFALWILALRWVLIDQRQRCPVCLRLLIQPVRIGNSSHTFLEWYGAESICSRGHGLQHIPEITASYSGQQEWLNLDDSWSARRRALFILSVATAWVLSAAVLFSVWPWRLATVHLAALAFLGIILAEFALDGAQKIPFTCSYLPGKSNLHLTFWLWVFLLVVGIVGIAVNELKALESLAASAAVLAGLGIAAAFCTLRNNWLALPSNAELRFEEIPPDQLVSLDLS